jgi:3-hydroxyisobutyrate dehydrogenase-like beta-hydroxyacid dehydrogenase
MDIGFVGAGLMGRGMVENLLRHGHNVSVIAHRNRAPIDALVERGATEAASLAELATGKQTLFLCVTDTRAAAEVLDAVAAHLSAGTMVIDITTNAPDGPAALAERVYAAGGLYVEAPVTGGPVQAADGVLGAIVGCDDGDFEAAKALLSCFCARVEHFGDVGMAVRAKLVSNFLALGTAALVIEAFKQARKLGVDWRSFYELAQLGSGNSGALQRILDGALEDDYGGYMFSVANTRKDLTYFHELAASAGAMPPLATTLKEMFENAVDQGYGDRMLSELLRPELDVNP